MYSPDCPTIVVRPLRIPLCMFHTKNELVVTKAWRRFEQRRYTVANAHQHQRFSLTLRTRGSALPHVVPTHAGKRQCPTAFTKYTALASRTSAESTNTRKASGRVRGKSEPSPDLRDLLLLKRLCQAAENTAREIGRHVPCSMEVVQGEVKRTTEQARPLLPQRPRGTPGPPTRVVRKPLPYPPRSARLATIPSATTTASTVPLSTLVVA